MTDAKPQHVIEMTPATSDLSRPVLHRNMALYSREAQQVARRLLDRVGYSLFSIEVILQLIADADDIDKVEDIIVQDIQKSGTVMTDECKRLEKLMADTGLSEADVPTYTRPAEVRMEISSPLVVHYGQLLILLDEVMKLLHTLWLNSAIDKRQDRLARKQWTQHLNKLSTRIIEIERRTRKKARASGKQDDVAKTAPVRSRQKNQAEKEANDAGEASPSDTSTVDAPSNNDEETDPPASGEQSRETAATA